MTEEDKKLKRELKAQAACWLHDDPDGLMAKWRIAIEDTDLRIWQYIHTVADNTDNHNLYELLALKRFFQIMDRHQWKPKRVKRFFKFYETLKFSGVNGRQRYRLTPVQCFQFACIFGFAADDGTRLVRTAYIFVPRKFSKTTSAASLAVYDLLLGDSNAQAYVGANSYNQAKICFDEIRAIVRGIDPGEKHFRVNREKITFKDIGHDSLAACLTANAKTLDGLNASLVIMDEYAQARNTAGKNGADLRNVLVSSMGSRREPLTVIITTASDVIDGPFAHELEGVKRMLEGQYEDDSVFAALFMPDIDDLEDDPRTWAKVQPHLGITVQPGFYQWQYGQAKLSPENMLAFRTKLLNIFTINEAKTWFTYEKATQLCCGFNIDSVTGYPTCAVAFDLSVRDDFSAVAYTLYSSANKKFYCHIDYYFPEGALPGHPNEQLYRRWHQDGYLKLCKGDKVDVRMIGNDIMARSKRMKIVRAVYDNWKAQDLVNLLYAYGARDQLQPYSQTYGSFNLPVESFEMMAYEDPPKIAIDDNPINVFCLTNCVIDEDHLENKKPIKISQYRKIDGVVVLLMTIGALNSFEQ